MLDPKKGVANPCECGCKASASPGKRFVSGHNRRGCGSVPLTFHKGIGRWVINCRDGTKVLYYRAVMENKIGRALLSEEIVHHKDEDPTNDDPDNLMLHANNAEHFRVEHVAQMDYSAMGKRGNEVRWR